MHKIRKNSYHSVLLSNVDIDNIMQRYAKHNQQFIFLPTSPIDFCKWRSSINGEYVRDDICNFNIRTGEYKNKTVSYTHLTLPTICSV